MLRFLPRPYLLFWAIPWKRSYAKTAFGLRDWVPDQCVGEFTCEGGTVTTGLPALTPGQAFAKGARGLVIGVANSGGFIPDNWIPALVEALQAGLDIVSGMHTRLAEVQALKTAAGEVQPKVDRCSTATDGHSDCDRTQTKRQTFAHDRDGLRSGQKIYRARAYSRIR